MGVYTSKPEQFSTRTELLGKVYVLRKFRVYAFGHNFYNPQTIIKYCCIHVLYHEATVTNGYAWFWDQGIPWSSRMGGGREADNLTL